MGSREMNGTAVSNEMEEAARKKAQFLKMRKEAQRQMIERAAISTMNWPRLSMRAVMLSTSGLTFPIGGR